MIKRMTLIALMGNAYHEVSSFSEAQSAIQSGLKNIKFLAGNYTFTDEITPLEGSNYIISSGVVINLPNDFDPASIFINRANRAHCGAFFVGNNNISITFEGTAYVNCNQTNQSNYPGTSRNRACCAVLCKDANNVTLANIAAQDAFEVVSLFGTTNFTLNTPKFTNPGTGDKNSCVGLIHSSTGLINNPECTGGEEGIDFNNDNLNVVVSGGTFTNCVDAGISISNSQNITIQGTPIITNTPKAIEFFDYNLDTPGLYEYGRESNNSNLNIGASGDRVQIVYNSSYTDVGSNKLLDSVFLFSACDGFTCYADVDLAATGSLVHMLMCDGRIQLTTQTGSGNCQNGTFDIVADGNESNISGVLALFEGNYLNVDGVITLNSADNNYDT